jgi:hypothetical protein
MIRQIVATTTADCPISVASAYAEAFLQRAEHGGDEAIVVAGPLRRRTRLTFGIASDAAQAERGSDDVLIRWYARTRWLPDFSGTLSFRIASIVTTTVVLNGSYRVPGGFAGFVFDEIAGGRIAHATAHDFVVRIARDLELRETAWRRRFGTAAIGAG